MNIKAIICLALLLGFHSQVVGSTNVTLVALGTNSTTFNVSTEQVCKIVYADIGGTPGPLSIVVMGGTFRPFIGSTTTLVPTVVGPATIRLNVDSIPGDHFCTLELSTPADSFLPSN